MMHSGNPPHTPNSDDQQHHIAVDYFTDGRETTQIAVSLLVPDDQERDHILQHLQDYVEQQFTQHRCVCDAENRCVYYRERT